MQLQVLAFCFFYKPGTVQFLPAGSHALALLDFANLESKGLLGSYASIFQIDLWYRHLGHGSVSPSLVTLFHIWVRD